MGKTGAPVTVYGADWQPGEPYAVEPGHTCPRCQRRVPHPKKPSSPTTKTTSYRVPVDEQKAHEEVLEAAAKFLGTHSRPHWKFQTFTLALAAVLQDESLRGFAHREAA